MPALHQLQQTKYSVIIPGKFTAFVTLPQVHARVYAKIARKAKHSVLHMSNICAVHGEAADEFETCILELPLSNLDSDRDPCLRILVILFVLQGKGGCGGRVWEWNRALNVGSGD
jgi:hypothetical protein